ncbi:MAG: hypothetical protein H7834_03735 [Magnetococcus sp. YQC-9]
MKPQPMEAIPPVEEPSGSSAAAMNQDARTTPTTAASPSTTPTPASPSVQTPPVATPPALAPAVTPTVPAPTVAASTPTSAPTSGASSVTPTRSAPQPSDNSPAGQWRRACLERLSWGKRMVEDGLNQCPKSGYMRQNCLDYYRGMERQYQGVTCDPKGGGIPMPGW